MPPKSSDLLGVAQSRAIPKPTLSLTGAEVVFDIGPDAVVRLRIGHVAFPVVVELAMRLGDVQQMRLTLAEVERQIIEAQNGRGE